MDSMKRIIALLTSLITVLGLAAEGLPYMFRPTLTVDAADSIGNVSSRASGFLYGIAEAGVPDAAMTESIDISSVSQKVIGGLQHPIGDVDDVSGQLDSCDYIVVYMQDCFDTWYYCSDEIMEQRRNGTYDWKAFLQDKFYPQVIEKTAALSEKEYASRVVYCPYNECDNGVWFGTYMPEGDWCSFDEAGRQNFYEAWRETYELIRSVNPTALIGGPGYYEYNAEKLESFLTYCKANSCVPDIMIYHELNEASSLFWQDHTAEYRALEKTLGINEIPIIVTEYGCMDECGAPSEMLRYIVAIEKSGVYGNVAFWRLANNLCDTAANANSPNSNWWLYRWYADMEGKLLNARMVDILHSDFTNTIKYNRNEFHHSKYTGMASITDDGSKLDVICGGSDYTGYINIKNLSGTKLNGRVNVKAECVYYEGLSGVVSSPTAVKEYTAAVVGGRLKIALENMDSSAVYHVTVTAAKDEKTDFVNTNLPVRYEFEEGTILGGAYTYDSAYASTGLQNGTVGGIENSGDGVRITVTAPESGEYVFKIIYGKANDGTSPDDRVAAKATITIDGESETISLPNTIKSEYTSEIKLIKTLDAGTHTVEFTHNEGTYVLDSMLVLRNADNAVPITVLPDSDRSGNGVTSFLAVAPQDGFYAAEFGSPVRFALDGAECETKSGKPLVYLRSGLNYIDVYSDNAQCSLSASELKGENITVVAENMALCGAASLMSDADGTRYIGGISVPGSTAEFKFVAPTDGIYRITVIYANNAEGGTHAYNVDLIESCLTVTIGEKKQNIMCRNTYSESAYETVTFNAEFVKGENAVVIGGCGDVGHVSSASYAPNVAEISINSAVFDGILN